MFYYAGFDSQVALAFMADCNASRYFERSAQYHVALPAANINVMRNFAVVFNFKILTFDTTCCLQTIPFYHYLQPSRADPNRMFYLAYMQGEFSAALNFDAYPFDK